MRKLKQVLIIILLLACSVIVYAQDGSNAGAGSGLMRSNGRIYVVVAVMLTILIGLILYLVRLDRKIGKLERNNWQ